MEFFKLGPIERKALVFLKEPILPEKFARLIWPDTKRLHDGTVTLGTCHPAWGLLGRLRRRGLVIRDGDLWIVTETGLKALEQDMSIDAVVEAVQRNSDGSGKLLLIDRPPNGIAGQGSLSFDSSPVDVWRLTGRQVWGGDDSLMFGEIEIAKRIGYGGLRFTVANFDWIGEYDANGAKLPGPAVPRAATG